MEWSDLAPAVGAVAPTLGKLLGGALPIPFGGAVGGAIGEAIASAIGVPADPPSVQKALGATPNDVKVAQLQSLEAEAAAKYKALADAAVADASVGVEAAQTTAATMQAELVAGTWYQRWWRPFAMYVWILSWPYQLWMMTHYPTGAEAWIMAFNAFPAAVGGVYAYGRSQEKIAALNGKS